ncbi:AI-2E family transporter [Myxococcota bacterium]|nr:AI-2E family transporter [Myxococcota bacterium]MBU1379452.1 AI-2E family transporter [Myxococcota bacterium]MBU1496155.1 AI-2E family transporter [Myxococcota bacterium]
MEKNSNSLDKLIKMVVTLGIIAALLWILSYLADVLLPFVIAFLIAYLINPLVVFYQKKIPSRGLSSALAIVTVLGFTVGILWLVMPRIATEIKSMAITAHKLATSTEVAQRAKEKLPENLWKAIKDYTTRPEFQEFLKNDDTIKIGQAVVPKLLPGIKGLISGAASIIGFLLGLTLIFLYLVFILIDFQKFRSEWKQMIPLPWREPLVTFIQDFNGAMNQYFRAQALIALVVGVLHAIGFLIIGLPLAIVFGLFVGLLNMVPYLQLAALVPAALLAIMGALESGRDIWFQLILTGSVFLVIQALQDLFIVPKIMGGFTGLSPAIILLSLSIWGKLLGFFGLVIAIPATCLVLAYYKQFLRFADQQGALTPEGAIIEGPLLLESESPGTDSVVEPVAEKQAADSEVISDIESEPEVKCGNEKSEVVEKIPDVSITLAEPGVEKIPDVSVTLPEPGVEKTEAKAVIPLESVSEKKEDTPKE